jgi:hypothetical protein
MGAGRAEGPSPHDRKEAKREGERAARVAQMIEHLCSKHKVLSSNPSTTKKTKKQKTKKTRPVCLLHILRPVAHTYNPSYSGGRGQEDCGSKPAWRNS